jgi:hypothetical protein
VENKNEYIIRNIFRDFRQKQVLINISPLNTFLSTEY